jgi:hypothetical protein
MYDSNLKEYAQYILDNKQIAVSTRAEWNMLIKRLPLEDFTYPPVEIDLYNMVAKKYPNPRTRRGVLQTLNCLLGGLNRLNLGFRVISGSTQGVVNLLKET